MMEHLYSCISRPSQHAESKAGKSIQHTQDGIFREAFCVDSVDLGFRREASNHIRANARGDQSKQANGEPTFIENIRQSTHHRQSCSGGSQAMGWYFSSSTGSGRSAQS